MRRFVTATLLSVTFFAACGSTEPEEARISVDRRAAPLEDMAVGRWLAGVPMTGIADVKIDLAAPVKNQRTLYSRAHGSFAFTCAKNCKLGDDTAQLDFGGQKLDVGHIDIDSLALRGTVQNGHAKTTQWKLVSPDVKLSVDVDIALADDLFASKVEGCIRFAPVAGLDTRRPKTWTVLQTTGASLDGTGMYSIRITGTLGAPKRLAQECGGQKLAAR